MRGVTSTDRISCWKSAVLYWKRLPRNSSRTSLELHLMVWVLL